jgi:HAMP domain-containing protein
MTIVENLRWRCPMTRLAVFYLVCLLAALVAAVWIARAFLVSN